MSERNRPELLAPAGSMESLKAAVNNGCDAIYLGGKAFSARQFAGNFSLEEMEEACDYCHLRGIKVYVTVNTLYKDSELQEFIAYIGELYRLGVDALLIQDIGGVRMVKEHFPDFPIHASTQMTTNSLADVEYWKEQGFSRVVLSRELNLDEIKEITENTDVEIETFVHGALCVCYSGQCIMSSILGGRSGNRGRCAQTCRLPYSLYEGSSVKEEGHLLSPKDMQTITILPKLIEAGILSLKVEGRMKNPEYVAGVVGIYRKYIDLYFENPAEYKVEQKDVKVLQQLFNRGGFSEGYYEDFAGREMMSIERPKSWGLKIGHVDDYTTKNNRLFIRTREALVPGDGIEVWASGGPNVGTSISKASRAGEVVNLSLEGNIEKNDVVYRTYDKALIDSLRKTWEKDTRKLSIWGKLRAKKGEPIALQLWDDRGHLVFVKGDVVEEATNQPLSEEKLTQQISKMGATPFVVEEMEIEMDGDIYLGVSVLNQLRRSATEALEEAIIKKSKRERVALPEKTEESKQAFCTNKKLRILVSNRVQLEAVVETPRLEVLYYESADRVMDHLAWALELCHKNGVKLFVALPKIARQFTQEKEKQLIEGLIKSNIDGFLVRSAGQLAMVKEAGKAIHTDYTLNLLNKESVTFWEDAGAASVCVSLEANLQEINQMGNANCEMVVYGYLPLMKTQQCPVGNYVGGKDGSLYCSKRKDGGLYFLRDRKEMKFPLMLDCDACVCTILNSKPLFTLRFYDEVLESVTGSVRLDFTKEGPSRAAKIAKVYSEMTQDPNRISVDARNLLEEMREKGSTKGHFFRGVE